MSEDSSDFKPLPRPKKKSSKSNSGKSKRQTVGASTPSAPRRATRPRASTTATSDAPASTRKRRARNANRFAWLKYVALLSIVGIGVYVILNLQPPPPVPPADATPDPNATLVPTSPAFFPVISFPPLLPTAAPTVPPTPTIPQIAIVAGHWGKQVRDPAAGVPDSGAVCADGLREVDITKSVADKTVALLQKRNYHVVLLEEFDARYEQEPKFAPKSFLSIHADSCLVGAEYAYLTGYKIAHAEPSDNEMEDSRLVTCLIRSYDRVAHQYDKPFNANTITRDMTEYHAFRKIDPTTPAAIIELGFMGWDRDFLVNHQDEIASGLATGLDDFLKGSPCVPATATPQPTETTLP